MICALVVLCAELFLLPRVFAQTAGDPTQVAARALDHAIIIDTHADTPQVMLDEGYDLSTPPVRS